MTTVSKCSVAVFVLLGAISPTHASPCATSIARVQAKVDAAIEKRAATDGWRPESLGATRGYQPTPRSLAATEGHPGLELDIALDSLNRARAADSVGDIDVCRTQLSYARAALRSQRH
ncbi:hypothetical protein CWS35_36410 [Bradyrhizobium sp. SK17]|uniref:hypothetical protein n=1 Tax=Bradyrhizobium sp. SK17 TaxID=2057741 RepID=UPI000C308919|nr:hypothetical protein [Bradyrhizobium sp. SK17]AUC99121.1 hypothetical protein CWS35_36410 [Bradyrhizobium sp. SK17]